jgi:hypothetical protein
MADSTAGRTVCDPEKARYVVVKKPPAPGAGTNRSRRAFKG